MLLWAVRRGENTALSDLLFAGQKFSSHSTFTNHVKRQFVVQSMRMCKHNTRPLLALQNFKFLVRFWFLSPLGHSSNPCALPLLLLCGMSSPPFSPTKQGGRSIISPRSHVSRLVSSRPPLSPEAATAFWKIIFELTPSLDVVAFKVRHVGWGQ